MTNTYTYKVAGHIFTLAAPAGFAPWERQAWHYEPFATEAGEKPLFSIDITEGSFDTSGLHVLFDQPSEDPGDISLSVFSDAGGRLVFSFRQPFMDVPNGWLVVDGDRYHVVIRTDTPDFKAWQAESSVTSAIMLSYMLATMVHSTLITHSACVVHQGKAYMFIGKSGTGKSTHSRLWLKAIKGTFLLNDDHPVIRFSKDDALPTIYGSPWSGKTHFYKNLSVPLCGIVRIKQAPHNVISRLSPLNAYASLTPTFANLSWERALADAKHASVEWLVMHTPCYLLECLPDEDAAIVCHKAVHSDNQ